MSNMACQGRSRRKPGATAALLVAYLAFNLGAGLCIKEGGTDAAHRLMYFVCGNALGITSTAFLMGVYARMNVNLAMVLATSGGFLSVQLVFWLLYRSPLTWVQGFGVLMVAAGTAMASRAIRTPVREASPSVPAVAEEQA